MYPRRGIDCGTIRCSRPLSKTQTTNPPTPNHHRMASGRAKEAQRTTTQPCDASKPNSV